MSSYLPRDSSGNYAEGGGLYAIGELSGSNFQSVWTWDFSVNFKGYIIVNFVECCSRQILI